MRLLIINDSKGKENGINEAVLTKLLRESKKLSPSPDFIVLGGDNVAGGSKNEILLNQLKRLREIISKYYPGTALIPIVGNHEVTLGSEDNSHEQIFSSVYSDTLPVTCLDGYNNTVYYRDYGNTRLMVLNAFHSGEFHRIVERQLKWLEYIASPKIKNKLLFVHSPAYPTGAHYGHCLDQYPSERDALINIVEKCNIKIIFSAHEHNYSRRKIGLEKKFYQIISGGGGEKLKDKYKDGHDVIVAPIAKYHFVLVDVNDNNLKISSISSEGRLLDEFILS